MHGGRRNGGRHEHAERAKPCTPLRYRVGFAYASADVVSRILAVFRAGFDAQWRSGSWPAAPLVMHGSISFVLCSLVSDALPPYGYCLYALSISAALISLPLLGDFGSLLRADPAAEWIEAQPVRRSELRIARTMQIALLIVVLVASALTPAAFCAPHDMGLAARFVLVAAGIAQAFLIAACLIGVQSLLGERAESLLVLLQTALVGGVIIGVITSLRLVPQLRELEAPTRALATYPPAWFAHVASPTAGGAWTLGALVATVGAGIVLVLAPLPPATRARRGGAWLGTLLHPVRALVSRVWVRRGPERAVFDLVYDALPLERDFVLRTYPMIGIPLALLAVGAGSEAGNARDGLLSLLLFTSATYLPIPIVYVQASASARARWLLDTAPCTEGEVARGAVKALAVRFLLPLYVLLSSLCFLLSDLDLVLRLALPGAMMSLIVMRRLYPMLVVDPPLSTLPDRVRTDMDWTGVLLGLGLALTIVAVFAVRFLAEPWQGALAALGLLAVDTFLDRRSG